MKIGDVLEILRRLDDVGIEWWIHGGWSVDALVGEVTREHDDLDLAVGRADVERLEASFSEFHRVRDEWPASFVLADASGRHIDIHPIRIDERGDGRSNRTASRSSGLARRSQAEAASEIVMSDARLPSSSSSRTSIEATTTSTAPTSNASATGSG
jgi:hypothetical protein